MSLYSNERPTSAVLDEPRRTLTWFHGRVDLHNCSSGVACPPEAIGDLSDKEVPEKCFNYHGTVIRRVKVPFGAKLPPYRGVHVTTQHGGRGDDLPAPRVTKLRNGEFPYPSPEAVDEVDQVAIIQLGKPPILEVSLVEFGGESLVFGFEIVPLLDPSA